MIRVTILLAARQEGDAESTFSTRVDVSASSYADMGHRICVSFLLFLQILRRTARRVPSFVFLSARLLDLVTQFVDL